MSRDRSSEASRIKARQARWRDIGACVRCGVPCDLNKRSGRPFFHCREHRIAVSAYTKRYYAKHGRRKVQQQEAAA